MGAEISLFNSASPFLIILSVFVAIIASYTALVLVEKRVNAIQVKKNLWVLAGAIAIGMGIFSMHFIGMMAYHIDVHIPYNPTLLLSSLFTSVISSFIAFYLLYFGTLNKTKIVISGLLIGIGIVSGHYLAIGAAEGNIDLQFNSIYFVLSLMIAVVFSSVAIKIFKNIKNRQVSLERKVISSVILGLAISFMHYISMDALVFTPSASPGSNAFNNVLLLIVFSILIVLTILAIAFAVADYRNLHAEKHLVEKLTESELRFRRLVELAPEPIVVHSGRKLVFVNKACLKMINVKDENEVLGKSILDFVAPAFQEAVKERIQHMMSGNSAETMEQQFITPSGEIIEVEVAGSQMEFEGKPAIQLVLRDITEQKKIRKELEESEQRYQSLFFHHPDGVYSMDCHGNLMNVNQSFLNLLGYQEDEFLKMSFHPVVAPTDLDKTLQYFQKALEGSPQNYEIKGNHKNGGQIYFNVTNIPIIVDGKITGIYGIAKDISKEKQALRLLEENEEKYRSLFEHNLDAVFEIDIDGSFMNVNKRAEELTSYTQAELRNMSFLHLIAENPARVHEVFNLAKQGNSLQAEQKLKDKNNEVLEVDINVVPIRKQGKVDGVFSIARDVSEKKKIEKKVNELAFTDQLTGLPNRHWFYQNLALVIEKARKLDRSLAVMLIDFDDFKGVNDLLGHYGGDLFLKKVSERIKACLRPTDRLSRHGGDEFIVVFENVTTEYINRLALKILNAMNTPVELMDHEMIVTISIGISMQTSCTTDEEILIRQADFAMYSAKEKGKNNYQVFTEDLNRKFTRKFQLENALRKAVEKDEFLLYYQPQIDLHSDKMVGLEALLRWDSPFGFVSPAEFIPIAEETGLILPIGEWVLEEACRQIKEWKQAGLPKVKVSVNVSARQFRDSHFSQKAEAVLTRYQIDPSYFEIEITESVMMDIEESSKVIKELRALGLKIAIDDFGAGYSSLTVIKNVEIDTLKIDKSLIDDVLVSPRNLSILKAIIEVGKGLHTNVVVEGIEEQEQVELLKNFDVIGQGYYYSRPCPPLGLGEMWDKVNS